MNISTGGPHILLFERDQQLAALLISELQLAGYECHTARTAVEVFDTIARYPIRLVLVNLAQAAAARREFWVALDAQRRDRKVQVFTFRVTNLAGYGPRDPDETSQATMADMEIDGMLGLMSLVDAVRARVPGPDNETTMNTMPRMPRASLSPQPQQNTAQQRPVAQPPQATPSSGTTGAFASSGSTLRAAPLNESGTSTIRGTIPPTPPTYTPPLSNTGSTGSTAANQPTYTEKIRAVLYPNQRTWSSQSGNSLSATSENRPAQETPGTISTPMPAQAPATPPFNDTSVLQRMANGQLGTEGGAESGLAQLSRIAQGFRLTETPPSSQTYQPSQTYQTPQAQTHGSSVAATPPPTPEELQQRFTNGNTGSQPQLSAISYQQPEASPVSPRTSSTADTYGTSTASTPYTSNTGSYPAVTPAPMRPATGTGSEKPGSQPLRASPIQDIPLERNGNTPALTSTESARRPDVLSRANYGPQGTQQTQQVQPTAPIPALTSIAPPQPTTPKVAAPPSSVSIDIEQPETTIHVDARKETVSIQAIEDAVEKWKERNNYSPIDKESAEGWPEKRHGTDFDATTAPSNAMLLDIVQSFPPMPAPAQQASSQAAQPHVLHGRATRSLGTVLLDGHLVPQDRLEVAQNIQRMLRGVDLNYQLGEILLMFKLLTPDQLLAASLVSYGLITTTQISALGRIRQELHAIGLEYDLENLVILFRILTPEQLREVRSSLQS